MTQTPQAQAVADAIDQFRERFARIMREIQRRIVGHDENGDRQFNMNAFGMPTEGYGFSNDAAALFAPPDFKSAAFTYNGKNLYIVINIRY